MELGQRGEDLAAAFLIQQGYTIVERNWRSTSAEVRGEIDIVAHQDNELVIVEVRTRQGANAADLAVASITPKKAQQLLTLAEIYRAQTQVEHDGVRIDVVVVAITSGNVQVNVYPNAIGF